MKRSTLLRSTQKLGLACVASLALIAQTSSAGSFDSEKLSKVLAKQPEAAKARYQYRNPAEVMAFFDVKPGSTVLEILPGGGWYTSILAPYLGADATLIGVEYDIAMRREWSKDPDLVEKTREKQQKWVEKATKWANNSSFSASAYTFADLPKSLDGTVDSALYIRALHNLTSYEEKGGYLSRALEATYRALKPGGTVGIVQHLTSDESARGKDGYLPKSIVIEAFKKAGFELAGESKINLNAKDKADAYVWRLPPVLAGTEEGSAEREKYLAIGESNRMTLKFVKPIK